MSNRQQTDIIFTEKCKTLLEQLPDYVHRYIRSISNVTSPRTRYEYLKDIQMFLNFIGADEPKSVTQLILRNLGREEFEDYIEYLEYYETDSGTIRSNSRTSIKRKLSSLRRFFGWMFETGFLPSDETRKLAMPKTHKKEIIALDRDEISGLLKTAESAEGLSKKEQDYHAKQSVRDTAILTLMLSSGIRVSECAELDVSDVDMKRSCLHIVRKGGNESTVYFSDEAAACLQAWLEERAQDHKVPDTETALFLSSRKQRLSVRSIEILVNKYAKRARIVKNITPHKLRSTFATALYQETGDIYLVAEALGHKDVTTTKEHYANMSETRKQQNRNRVKLFQED